MCVTFSLFPEPQAPPEILSVFDIRQTSLNVSWSLIGPRPGQVTYTVMLNAAVGAPSETYTVKGIIMFLTKFSTKILVSRLANGGRMGGRSGGRAYPKWRQTVVSAQ